MTQRTRFRTGLYGCLAFLGLLVFLEAAVRGNRIEKPGDPYSITFTTSRGEPISKRSGQLKLCMAPYSIYKFLPNQQTACCTIDAHGFRGPSVNLAERRSLRVILLGGSAAFGQGAASDGDTFAGILASRKPDWQVINAGVTGYVSGQELAYLLHDLIDLDPDVVVVYDGWNDLFIPWYGYDSMGGEVESTSFREIEYQLILNHRNQTRVTSSLGGLFSTLWSQSELLEVLSGWVGSLKGGEKMTISHTQRPEDEAFFERMVTKYIQNIDKMGMVCRSRGIRFMVAMQLDLGLKPSPSPQETGFMNEKNKYAEYQEVFAPLYRRFIQQALTASQLADETIFDMNTEPRALASTTTLLADWVHLSAEGHRLVADVLDEKIAVLK